MVTWMRDQRGQFTANLTAHERALYDEVLGRVELRRVLTAPFEMGSRRA